MLSITEVTPIDFARCRTLIVLQNAYCKGDLANGYHPQRWLRELKSSHTGTRLISLVGGEEYLDAIKMINTTPELGFDSHERLPIDFSYVRRRLREINPSFVIACGGNAKEACLSLYAGDLVITPHPASRSFTNVTLEYAAKVIRGRVLWYARGGGRWPDLPKSITGPSLRVAISPDLDFDSYKVLKLAVAG